MSIKSVKVIEPRVNVVGDEDQTHMILFGGSRVTEQIVTADSSQIAPSNPINALFTINPPSTLTIIDRNVRIRAFVEVKTDQPHQLGLNDALRQYPLNSIIDVTAVSVNGENVSENSGDKLHAMKCYGESLDDQGRVVSTTPTYPDQYQEYGDYVPNGTAKNALGGFGENATMQGARGGFVVDVIDSLTFRCVLTECLEVAPFANGIGPEHEGMVNVNQMNINLRFKSELTKILSHATTATSSLITAVSCQFYERPQCLVRFITPNMSQYIPDIQHLDFFSDQDYIKTAPTVAAGASNQVTSDAIKLGQIPESVTIFLRHSRATSNFNKADSFCRIDSISVLFNNESGLFSTATTQDLYEISSKNGCNLSYPAWSNYRGSVLRLRFGVDIGLPDYLAAGTQSQSSIQITVNYTNTGSQTFEPELYTVYRNIGTFSVFENGARASVGNFTPDIVREALNAPEMHYEDYRRLMGGSFWSKLKGFANKVAHLVQRTAPVAGKVASVLYPEAMPVISGISKGADVVAKATGGRLAGGRIRRRMR